MKNILMIVVDCARSEKTILDIPMGNEQTRRSAPLPFLEYLRTEGTTWTNYNSVSSTTTPNFASMLTGLLPVQHGIQEHSRFRLLDNVITLPQILAQHGYHTVAEMSGPLIPEAGLDRGFQHYRWRDKSEYLHKGFLEHLSTLLAQLPEPWFLCLHFWEAHQPYQGPKPFNSIEYGQTAYDRALSFIDHSLYYLLEVIDFRQTSVVYTSDHGERLTEDYFLNRKLGGDNHLILEMYNQFIRQNPGVFNFNKWFNTVKNEMGEADARIYAHNVLGHGFHLTEELVRIPLIIVDRDYSEAGKVNHELRGQTDLFATVLDLAGISEAEVDRQMSKSLFNENDRNMVYIEANGSGGKQYSSRCYLRGAKSKRWKFWRMEAEGLEYKVLWDLHNDPRETTNVIEMHPDIALEMDAFVDMNLTDRRSQSVDLETIEAEIIEERLRDLGYIE